MRINPNSSLMLRNNSNVESIKNKAKNLDKKDDEKLLEVCQDFESFFLYMMMKEMRKTVPEDGLIDRSQAMMLFEEMYMEEMAKEISKSDEGIGLANMMYEQLKGDDKIILD